MTEEPVTRILSDLHIHSTFSDGRNTPQEIIEKALSLGYQEVAIVDHVRRTSDWLDAFQSEIDRLKEIYNGRIKVLSGIEAKVINLKGDIDARPEFFSKVDFVLGAFHRLPCGQDLYLNDSEIALDKDKALEYWFAGKMKLLENPDVDVIAHPTAIMRRKEILVPYDLKVLIAKQAAANKKILETNSKYRVPDDEFKSLLQSNGVKLVFGSDSHSVAEMHETIYWDALRSIKREALIWQ